MHQKQASQYEITMEKGKNQLTNNHKRNRVVSAKSLLLLMIWIRGYKPIIGPSLSLELS